MELRVSDEDAALLRELLDHTVRDLNYEIADTDRSTFRDSLRERRERLASLLEHFGGPLPDAP